MPFACSALAGTVLVDDLVLLLTVGVPRLEGALLDAVDDGDFGLEGAVLVPSAGLAGAGIIILLVLLALVVESAPDADFMAEVVVFALTEDIAVGMPPGPGADMDRVVGEGSLDVCLTGVEGVVLLVVDLGGEGGREEEEGEEELR